MDSYLYDNMWDRQVRRVRCISPYSHDCRSWEASICPKSLWDRSRIFFFAPRNMAKNAEN